MVNELDSRVKSRRKFEILTCIQHGNVYSVVEEK